ncbi:MAG TPA: peptide ABC transporter substrate-binding protein [Candidatus Dormibacteraeota bacterium]
MRGLGRASKGSLLFVLSALLLSACHFQPPVTAAKLDPSRGGSATEAIVGRPGSLNPLFAAEDDARDIDALVYQGLTTIGRDQQPAPMLASHWSISADGLTYVFTLRQGVRWADGQPLTVDDVLFTFGVLQSPAYPGATGTFWRDVKVDSPGAWQIRFVLKAPSASFPAALRIGIIPRHAFHDQSVPGVADDPHSSGQAFGTGPFQVSSISGDGLTVTLIRNTYARPAPYLDTFVFRSYPTAADAIAGMVAGEADVLGGLQPPQLDALVKRPDISVRQIPTFTFTALILNTDPSGGPFGDPAVRLALQRGVDRQGLIKGVLAGRGLVDLGPIPPSDWAYTPPATPKATSYDLAAAAAGLTAAGWTPDPKTGLRAKGGTALRVTLDAANAYPYLQVADAVRKQLRKIGVVVDVQPVSASELVGRYLVGRNFQMVLAAFDNGPDPDQWTLWHSGQPAGGLNFALNLPHQALIDKDLEDGRAGQTRAARKAAYADFQALLWQASPALFLYEPDYLYAVSSRVKGVSTNPVLDPADRFLGVAGWYVSTRNQ